MRWPVKMEDQILTPPVLDETLTAAHVSRLSSQSIARAAVRQCSAVQCAVPLHLCRSG